MTESKSQARLHLEDDSDKYKAKSSDNGMLQVRSIQWLTLCCYQTHVWQYHVDYVICVFAMLTYFSECTVSTWRTAYVAFCFPWWRHQMETFSALLALCAGNSPVPVNSPHKGQWRGALMFSFICAWINDWVNNREADDLRRQDGHYDVIVMLFQYMLWYGVLPYFIIRINQIT